VNSGVGYAIPSNQIKNFLPKMMKGGESAKIFHGMVSGLTLAEQNTQGQGQSDGRAVGLAGRRRRDQEGRPDRGRERLFDLQPRAVSRGDRDISEKTEVTLKVKRDDEASEFKVELDRYNPIEGLGLGLPSRPAPTRPRGAATWGLRRGDQGRREGDGHPPGLPGGQVGAAERRRDPGDQRPEDRGRDELLQRLWQRKPGARVKFTVKRGADELEIEAVLDRNPDDE